MNYKIIFPFYFVGALFGFKTGYAQKSTQPNIVLIFADDLGYGDLSCYGGIIPTPNIDKIGQNGIRFTDFYSQPVCTPARYSLLTGKYPQRSKHNLNFALMPLDSSHLDITESTIASVLRKQNYQTAIMGKWHLGTLANGSPLFDFGFDSFTGLMGGCIDYFTHSYGTMGLDWYVNGKLMDEKGYSTDLITKHAINFIDTASKKPTPFFLYLPYNAPHYGKTDMDNVGSITVSIGESNYKGIKDMNTLQAPKKYWNRFKKIKDPYKHAYAAMLSCLDDNIGKLLKTLEAKNLLENTIIWFISDNGGYSKSYFSHASNGTLRGEKAQLWEGGIRVPAMVCWNGKIRAGQIVSEPVISIDIFPTTLSMINSFPIEQLTTFDGINISPLLLNGEKLPLRNLFWSFQKQTAIRRGDWKLVNETELFNLRTDTQEANNVSGKHPETVAELQKEMEKWKTDVSKEK